MFKEKRNADREPCFYWRLYEKGIDYLNKKKLIERTRRSWNFFLGRQWEGIKFNGSAEELPFFNFIKPNIQRLTTIIHQNRMTVKITDIDDDASNDDIYRKLTNVFDTYWDKSRMDIKFREMIKNAAITGDGVMYFGTSNVADVQLLDNTSILYGDESESDIQRQPYIIIWQRESIKSVRKQAMANGIPEDEIELIVSDNETEYMIGNRDEVDESFNSDSSKVTTLIYMAKKDGKVIVAKATKNVIFEEAHPISSMMPDGTPGKFMSLYPMVKFSWDLEPNNARGVSPCEMLIPNQIEINKTLARISLTTKLTAYPKLAYIDGMVTNVDALKKVGEPIALDNTNDASSVNQIISYLQPATPTQLPQQLMDTLLDVTQELAGSGDVAMGNVNDLQRVAASAVNAVTEKSESMHDEVVTRKEIATEDLCWIFIEHMQLYEPEGLMVRSEIVDDNPDSPTYGEKMEVVEKITAEEIDGLKPQVKIDVTKANAYAIDVKQNIVDNMFNNGQIDLKEYAILSKDNPNVPSEGIKQITAQREAQQMAMPPMGEPPQEDINQ